MEFSVSKRLSPGVVVAMSSNEVALVLVHRGHVAEDAAPE